MTLEHKNPKLQELISSLKKQSIEHKVGLWKRVALELERPTRHQRIVNLTKIEKYANENDVVIVPGKLLSGGELTKKVTIIVNSYSQSVVEKIGKSNIISIEEALKKYPNAKDIKIIG